MVHALIFAGGMGTRMKSEDLPKQFIEVDGKAIIIRTLEHFSHHNEVDKIVIVCVESWIDYLLELLKINAITKVSAVIPGGRTGYDSIHNGLIEIAGTATDEDIVLICDGVRPVLT
ncbi:MAG: 2-C-methyl-D-erythritol 4-phosphate cytidylyltransferase, partial [Clostridium sp.]|nr:2-C-methyl-D-erythritol 4-phosphate cytidylyltransferase [Clostridium sp.]